MPALMVQELLYKIDVIQKLLGTIAVEKEFILRHNCEAEG